MHRNQFLLPLYFRAVSVPSPVVFLISVSADKLITITSYSPFQDIIILKNSVLPGNSWLNGFFAKIALDI
jgi:hypothetical protein